MAEVKAIADLTKQDFENVGKALGLAGYVLYTAAKDGIQLSDIPAVLAQYMDPANKALIDAALAAIKKATA